MKGEKTFPRVKRSIRNNLVKFADNLPTVNYRLVILKDLESTVILMKNESNQQLNS